MTGGPIERAVRRARERGRDGLAFSSTALDEGPDFFELFAANRSRCARRLLLVHPSEGFELLALGCAVELRAGGSDRFETVRAAAAAWFDAAVGTGARPPLAVGGFAFAPGPREARWRGFGDAALFVPELLFVREGDETVLVAAVRVGPDDEAAAVGRRAGARHVELLDKGPEGAPAAQREAAPHPGPHYCESVASTVAAIRAGRLRKAVIADRLECRLPAPLHEAATLRALARANPGARTFAQAEGEALFLGATPERLARLRAGRLCSDAVAGTCAAPVDEAARRSLASALRASAKDREEHGLVVQHLVDALRPLCRTLHADAEPRAVRAGGVQHLRTRLRGEVASGAHVLEAVRRLHPSPALAGTPVDEALALIRRIEDFDRGGYGGPLGWFDARGEGDFFVALRCGLVEGLDARLYAGSGIVAGSDPACERDETALKIETLWRALHTT